MKTKNLIVLGVVAAVLIACGVYYYSIPSSSSEEEVKSLVMEFGSTLDMVSLTAPKEVVIQSIKDTYGPYISSGLLEGWTVAPERAPGRTTSSPWPDRIEILSITLEEDGVYDVQGKIIEVTSTEEGTNKAASAYPVALKIRYQDGKWVITGFTKLLLN